MAVSFKDAIQQIKEQADIVAVVGRTVSLKKAGTHFKGLCPFHQEKTPSFTVNPARGIFHCFGCGAGGSVIDFIMKTEHLEFAEAARKLAAEMGIDLPDHSGPRDRGERDAAERHRRALQSVNDFALTWFRRNLTAGKNATASSYVRERGIRGDLAERFQLGASLEGWDGLVQAAKGEGFSEDLLVEAGLCVRSERRGTVYDRFRNRLMFPILDHLGRSIGFGGRRLDDDPNSPKYLNSAETPLYKKGKSLYALNWAQEAISRTGYAILTEGYMDTLMAHQYGFSQAVASLGTALTPEQARLVKRFTTRTYFLYDGDSAGQKAMLRAGEALLGAGLDARVITLPPEDDPDSFLRREGPEALKSQISGAGEYFDFALRAHSADLEMRTLAGQGELAQRVAPLIMAVGNEVSREAAISRLLRFLGGMPREAVEALLANEQKSRASSWNRGTSPAGTAPYRPESAQLNRQDLYVLRLMAESPIALDLIRSHLEPVWIQDEHIKAWVLYFYDRHEEVEELIAEAEAENAYPADPSVLSAALADPIPVADPGKAVPELLDRLKRRHHRAISSEMIRRLGDRRGEETPERIPGILGAIHEESLLAVKRGGGGESTRS